MKFNYESFSCDVDTFYNNQDISGRFHDSSKEPEEDELICNNRSVLFHGTN